MLGGERVGVCFGADGTGIDEDALAVAKKEGETLGDGFLTHTRKAVYVNERRRRGAHWSAEDGRSRVEGGVVEYCCRVHDDGVPSWPLSGED